MTRKATIKNPAAGQTVAIAGDVYRFVALGEDTDGKYAHWEAIVPPGGGPPPHTHSREDEGFFVVEGEMTFLIGAERLVACAGTFVNLPVGVPHAFRNDTSSQARLLITIAPAGLEKMFLEPGRPVPAGTRQANPPSQEEVERLVQTAPRYGVRIDLPGAS
jgi:quercetin dioxygenase-like cupin family protein